MPVDRQLTRAGHVHQFGVTCGAEGWEVLEKEDSAVVQRARRKDWHRVEIDIRLFEMTALALKRDGWIET